jgi:excisionase family DNA binding protein
VHEEAHLVWSPALDGEWLTRAEAAVLAGVSVRTIDRAIADGRLRAGRTRPRGAVRIARAAVTLWLAGGVVSLLWTIVMVMVAVALLATACGDDCGVHAVLRHFSLDVDHPRGRHG